MPRFSIIVPLFNKEKFIVQTIESIINQGYSDFEVIIVDDGSTDNSYQEACKISDKRLKVIRTNNFGVSSARNLGLSNALGDFICFLDADDQFSVGYLQSLTKLIDNQEDIDLIITNWYLDGHIAITNFEERDLFKFVFRNNHFSWITSYCFSRRYLSSNNLIFDVKIKIGEDKEYLINAFRRSPKYCFNKLVELEYDNRDMFSATRDLKRYSCGIRRTFFSRAYRHLFTSEIYLFMFVIRYYYSNKKDFFKFLFSGL